jgi:peptide-methionine (S)-S-oxide reductase
MTGQFKSIVLSGGCFWCLEAAFQLIEGVESVIPGYTGGTTQNPSYEEVCTGTTGHAEAVRITYDPQAISLEDILHIFWTIHDPTTLNRQGNDVGTEYRSIIFYADEKEKEIAERSIEEASTVWDNPVVTELKPLQEFYEAEAYHHNFFKNHPEQAYCQVIINPKLEKLRRVYSDKLKSNQ